MRRSFIVILSIISIILVCLVSFYIFMEIKAKKVSVVEGIVQKCEEVYNPQYMYMLGDNGINMYSIPNCEYSITFKIGEAEYVVTRTQEFKVGQSILVRKIEIFDFNGQVIRLNFE